MVEITNTGERILLEKESAQMIARHFCAYKFARGYAAGKVVLEIGCGEGYGSFYLADSAKEVTAIDYSNEAIEYAKSKYKKENLRFQKLDVRELSTLNKKFDLVCSFQVIEHIQDTGAFLKNIRNLLNEGGIFICSTPNRLDASPNSETPLNKFHLKEYLAQEFKQLLGEEFRDVEMYGLHRGTKLNFYRRLKKIGIFNFLPQTVDPVKKFYANIECDDFVISKEGLERALDFIALCK